MKKILTVIGLLIIIGGPVSCTVNHRIEVNKCAAKGVEYFKSIGAYPKLQSTGADAEREAVERCQRTYSAFTDDIVQMGKEIGPLK